MASQVGDSRDPLAWRGNIVTTGIVTTGAAAGTPSDPREALQTAYSTLRCGTAQRAVDKGRANDCGKGPSPHAGPYETGGVTRFLTQVSDLK